MPVERDIQPRTQLLPASFLTSATKIASYDWVDLASGIGYRRYYICQGDDSASVKKYLTGRVLDSHPTTISANWQNQTWTEQDDSDFDIEFLVPAVITGKAYVNVTTKIRSTIDSTSMYLVITFYHYDGETETSIGTVQTDTLAVTADTDYSRENLKVSLTQKKFAVGDILRISIQMWGKRGGNQGTCYGDYYTDPGSRATVTAGGSTADTNFILDIPFKVQL